MKGRLNIFQATMLRWRELHPYNAVHVVRVDAPLETPRLTQAIDAVLAARGLTGLVLDTLHQRYEYLGGPPQTALEVLAGGDDPHDVLRAAMERGINMLFSRSGQVDPFRFFAVDAETSFHFGVAYDHVVAGGESIVGLLAEVVLRYGGAAARAAPRPSLYQKTCGRMLVRHAGYILAGLTAVPGIIASARRALRPRYPRGTDRQNAFTTVRIDRSGVAKMSRAARAWGVTRADLMIALLMNALAPLAGDARHGARRHEIGIAVIVNIRGDFGTSSRDSFGQFLSSYRYGHPVPEGIALNQLALDVHRETARVRRRKLYLLTLLVLAGVGLLWPWLSPARRGAVDAKNYPAWAGLTPLDVDAVWREACGTGRAARQGNARAAERGPERGARRGSEQSGARSEADPSGATIQLDGAEAAAAPLEYLRAVSTGPASPLIVAATTAGGELNLGFSYRIAAYTAEDIARIAAALTEAVNNLDA